MTRIMPDIASTDRAREPLTLDRAGMSGIEIPVHFDSPGVGTLTSLARAEATVSLDDPNSKGIHMSRLYLGLQNHLKDHKLEVKSLPELIKRFLESHEGLSNSAFVSVSYDHMIQRPSLLSSNVGWRSYPVTLEAEKSPSGELLKVSLQVTYSSTCPCSAALSRQIMQERFQKDFPNEPMVSSDQVLTWLEQNGSIATPHGQRSTAFVDVVLEETGDITVTGLIDAVESALRTPVQAVVKREDEQEFARLNGENLMFAEDAARRITAALDRVDSLKDFKIKVAHFESLHPHEATAYASKPKEDR